MHVGLEGSQVLRDGPPCRAFHAAVPADHIGAKGRERRRPAATAAQPRAHDRPFEQRVHALDEQPRRAIRHLHPARGLADRAAVTDQFQDLDLAWPKGAIGVEVEPKLHARHVAHVTRSSSGELGGALSDQLPPSMSIAGWPHARGECARCAS